MLGISETIKIKHNKSGQKEKESDSLEPGPFNDKEELTLSLILDHKKTVGSTASEIARRKILAKLEEGVGASGQKSRALSPSNQSLASKEDHLNITEAIAIEHNEETVETQQEKQKMKALKPVKSKEQTTKEFYENQRRLKDEKSLRNILSPKAFSPSVRSNSDMN